MKQAVSLVLIFTLAMSSVIAAESTGFKVDYDGGSLTNVKSGTNLRLAIADETIAFSKGKEALLSIPATAITELSYGQDVHRRVGAAIGLGIVTFGIGGLMALSKSKKHYIGITWDNDGKKGGLAFQADKDDYRGILTGLEGVTGKKAINSDTLSVKN